MKRVLPELSLDELHRIGDFIPGDFVVYRVRDLKLDTLFYSPGVPALSGMDASEYDAIVARDAVDIVAESDREFVVRKVAESLASGHDNSCVYRIRHTRSGYVWVRANARLVGTIEGDPVLISLFMNTSADTSIYEELLDQLQSKIFVTDAVTLEMLYANKAAQASMPNLSGTYMGKTCYQAERGLDEACPWCTISDLPLGETYEGEHRSEDGTVSEWVVRKHSMWCGHDAFLQFVDDITEQKRLQAELQRQKDNLQRIVDNIPAGICVFNMRDGVISRVMTNRFMRSIKHVDAWDIEGESGDALFRRVHPDDVDRMKREFSRMFDTGRMQAVYRTRNGWGDDYRWMHANGLSFKQDDGSKIAYVGYADITEQHLMEQRLRESNEKYTLAINHAGLGLWEYVPGEHRAYEEYSVVEHQPVRKIIEDFPEMMFKTGMVHEDSIERMREFYQQVDAGVESLSDEFWIRDVSGEFRYDRISCVAIPAEGDLPAKIYGIAQDITDLKRAEERYRRELEDNRLVSENNLIARGHDNLTKNEVIEFSLKDSGPLPNAGDTTYDGAYRRLASMNIAEPDRARVFDMLHREKLIERFQRGESEHKIDFKRLAPGGTPMWMSLACNVFREPHTGDIECFIYLYDITESTLERQIIRNLPRLGQIAIGTINTKSGSYRMFANTLDIDGVTQRVTGNFAEDIKWLAKEYIREDERERVTAATTIEAIVAALETTDVLTVYYDLPGSSEHNPRRHRAQLMYLDDDRDILLFSHTDVTEQTRHEQTQVKRIAQALHEAKQANRAKSDFLNRLSHDIRTPMNVIYGMTDYAFKDIDDKEKLKGDLERIASANTFLLSLINDILDISKIESGQMELHPEPYPYREFLENILGMFQPMCEQKDIRFDVRDEGVAHVIDVDKVRFNQVVLNLLSNAVKYTPAGGSITVAASTRQADDGLLDVIVSVQDTGTGIDPEFQKVMFEPFSQNASEETPLLNQRGTGLGLAIVKRIVELMDGTITVESELGQGSTFTVRMRVGEAEQPPAFEGAAHATDAGEGALDLGCVLLVEDHPINAEIATRMLEEAGVEVNWAENGRVGVQMFERSEIGEYDAVLMDIQMPAMNGYEATRAIRALQRPDAQVVPIVAMTADAYVEDVQRCIDAGMDGHVAKPIDSKVLFEELVDARRRAKGQGASTSD